MNHPYFLKRLSVSIFFFVNGFLYASPMARLPELQRFFGISNSALGLVLFCGAAGSLMAMPLAGWLTNKYGSDQITRYSGLMFCLFIPMIPLLPSVWAARFFFFMVGFSAGSTDVSMNGQAVYVERLWGKSIMSSFHAVFSIGMALGAGVGGMFSKFEIPLFTHLVLLAVPCIGLLLWASTHLLKDQPTTQTDETTGFQLPTKAILPLGIMAFCGMTGEGSMIDWSAMFMNKVLGQSESFSALAFGTFGTAMTIGRIFGDTLTERLGKSRLLIFDSLLAIVGLCLVLVFLNVWVALVGFFLMGFGLSTVVPIIYSTAGNTPNVPPSVGIAMATTIGYAGFFVGPPTIGFLSDVLGLRIALCFTLFLLVLMMVLILRYFKET